MKCVVCDQDNWKNVDEYRVVAKGMCICNSCGFVSYPQLYKSEEEIKAHYRTDYRKIPKAGNLYTGTRKLHFHGLFLGPTLREIAARTKTPVIGEIGAAYGIVLNWLKTQHFPNGDFSGTELTTTYRRVAFHEYGINLSEDFDLSKKYDLIISYKVAEHQLDVDKRLREYALALKPEGYLYISVPTWFDQMSNFGLPGFDLEYYYAPDHINSWTQKLFETVLKKAGLEVVKFDGEIYDKTYLCKRNDALMENTLVFEDPKEIESRMAKIKQAFLAMNQGLPQEAIKIYPNYPMAWFTYYEKTRAQAHKHHAEVSLSDILKEYYEPFRAACGDCVESLTFAADICMRYDDYQQALDFWQRVIALRPGAGEVLRPITQCFRVLAEKAEKLGKFESAKTLRKKSIEITKHWVDCDLEHRAEALGWLYYDESKLEMPSEGVQGERRSESSSGAEAVL